MTTRLQSVCADCGTVYERDRATARCPSCTPADDGAREYSGDSRVFRGSRHERGYDARWSRLSRRARKLQPFCSDCGATDDLTGDHSVAAWERKQAGKVIRLQDIDVVCRRCNGERGAARGVTANDDHRPDDARLSDLAAELEQGLDTEPVGGKG